MSASTDRATWPLWEVFVRGKRGLSHVHVGSLHAPDATMALRNARDVYTRRQEGVSLWVVRASDITASLAGRARLVLRPRRRQGLPPPDVLRRARGRGVPVSDTSMNGAASRYLLGLADDALVYAQRLGEWVSRGPQIEEDMALANIGLDLLGQARALLTRVGELDGTGRSEDDLAYFRDEREFRNVHLVEQERAGFGFEMARLLWFSSYQNELYAALRGSSDPVLAGVAAKALKEVDYHRDHATQWVLRLGDGTAESHERMQQALSDVQPYVAELFDDDAGVGRRRPGGRRRAALEPPGRRSRSGWLRSSPRRRSSCPRSLAWRSRGGREGVHSRPMGYLLAELQHIARSHPGASW